MLPPSIFEFAVLLIPSLPSIVAYTFKFVKCMFKAGQCTEIRAQVGTKLSVLPRLGSLQYSHEYTCVYSFFFGLGGGGGVLLQCLTF